MHVVVVESPAKAKTINKYLGPDFQVLASYGHVRDLPAKDGSVDPEQDFAMAWEVDPRGEKRLKEIAQAVRNADQLYLATDPDREGEAISWHIIDELKKRKALKDKPVKRVVFNEITKNAVVDAFKHPRDLNQELIDAYLARRALDYLVGFTLSPVLWRKLPGSKSAGRVQSVALRLICEREAEIETFKPREYWTVAAFLKGVDTVSFETRLTRFGGRKLDKFDLDSEAKATEAVRLLEAARSFTVESIEKKQVKRNPQPPFTTSTLQQEASRKLGFGATQTMRVAQKLYEGFDIGGETLGLITYMRTDGVSMSNEAVSGARRLVSSTFGDRYLPDAPRIYKSKAKNAQEAHEAIRPTDFTRQPSEMRHHLPSDEARLYELIWKRALASQMESALLDQVTVDVAVDRDAAMLRATGTTVAFDGYYKLYQEGRDDNGGEPDDGEARLPRLEHGQDLNRERVVPQQHFTQPPPRYSEASLVKRLEELGIGRPSTYASILQVLQDRDYVTLEKRRFLPQDRGRLVTAFLSSFFERYVQYDFTAKLEEELDDVSGGRIDWRSVLRRFWEAFSQAIDGTKELRITNVIDTLDEVLGPHFFPRNSDEPDKDPRRCPACGEGRLGLRLGRSGGFIGCSNYPDCRFTKPLAVPGEGDGEDATVDLANQPRVLGQDPQSGLDVTLRKGPFGIYVQLGDAEAKGEKPKRVSLPPGYTAEDLGLQTAIKLLSLPRSLGHHEGSEITAGIGRYGPYVKRGPTYKSIPSDEDVLHIGLNRAVDLLAQAPRKAEPLRTLGPHPSDGEPVTLHKGRYGPYLKHGRLNASLPRSVESDAVTMEQAVEILNAQAAKKGAKKTTKKASTKKPAAKKSTAKKPSANKAAAKLEAG